MDKKKSTDKPKIATLGSLRKPELSENKEEGQAFYVGGSSGQQVLGPSKNNENPDELITNMFKAVKEAGAEAVNEAEEEVQKKRFDPFKGANRFYLSLTSFRFFDLLIWLYLIA